MNKTIRKIREDLDSRKYSSEELTKKYLNTIKEKNESTCAFLEVFEEDALLEAKKADEKIKKGEASILTGIPCAIKDNILIKGRKCSAGSKMLENYIASYDAFVIKKLKNQGVVFLGKTNMDEFAIESRIRDDLAVDSEMCVFSLGSSLSNCNTVRLKPTYGSVSRNGLIAYTSSLDQIEPIANIVEDVKIVYDVIKGKDEWDSTNIEMEENEEISLKNIKIGVSKEYSNKENVQKCKELGAEIIEISLPHSKYALPCYDAIASAEASANLARFDGIRYGLEEVGRTLDEVYINTRTKGFGDEVKKRIMLGNYVLSFGHYDACFKKALKVRSLIKKDFDDVFKKVDIILGDETYSTPVRLAGLPTLSIQSSLYIITSHFKENKLFNIAK